MKKDATSIPIIAIDGTTASGKGTIAYRLAQHLGFNYLNSGALYRLVAFMTMQDGHKLHDTEKVIATARKISPTFEGKKVIINGQDVWPIISSQEWGQHASVISPIKEVREAIHHLQRSMIKHPGLVAEGRDMATNVFVDAHGKLYLDASIEARAKRRHKDELEKESGKTLEEIAEELRLRDERDKHPSRGPYQLRPAEDGHIVDTTHLTIEEVMHRCLSWCKEKGIM
jgi:cytidylate kinase